MVNDHRQSVAAESISRTQGNSVAVKVVKGVRGVLSLEESDIAYHQEVMTGYENNPIVPTSHGVEPLTRRCSQGAEVNEAISFVPKQIASANNKDRSSIIYQSPLVNHYEIASAIRSIPMSPDPERVAYKSTPICNTSPHYAKD